jgi:hypothetical protein
MNLAQNLEAIIFDYGRFNPAHWAGLSALAAQRANESVVNDYRSAKLALIGNLRDIAEGKSMRSLEQQAASVERSLAHELPHLIRWGADLAETSGMRWPGMPHAVYIGYLYGGLVADIIQWASGKKSVNLLGAAIPGTGNLFADPTGLATTLEDFSMETTDVLAGAIGALQAKGLPLPEASHVVTFLKAGFPPYPPGIYRGIETMLGAKDLFTGKGGPGPGPS